MSNRGLSTLDFRVGSEATSRHSGINSAERFFNGLRRVELAQIPKENQECGICREQYGLGIGDETICRLPCGHYFGTSCICNWLCPTNFPKQNTFPACRHKLFDLDHGLSNGGRADRGLSDRMIQHSRASHDSMAAAEALTEGIAALVDDFDTIQEYNLAGIRGEKPRLPHGHFLEDLVWPGREMMVSVSTLVIFEEFSRNPSVFSNRNIATIAATMCQLLGHLQANVETAGLPIPWALHGPRIDLLRDQMFARFSNWLCTT